MKRIYALLIVLMCLIIPLNILASNGGGQSIEFYPLWDSTNSTAYTGVKIYHYAAGTTSNEDCWSDEAKTSAVSNPFVDGTDDATADGFVRMFCDGDMKFVIKDEDDVTLLTLDSVKVAQGGMLFAGSTTAGVSDTDRCVGTFYPAATVANRFQICVKTNADQSLDEVGMNKTGSAFSKLFNIPQFIDPNDYDNIDSAVTACESAGSTVLVYDTQTLAANLVVDSNCGIIVINGGIIDDGADRTLAINGDFQAGLYEVFTGFSTGDVSFGNNTTKEFLPQWWGAVCDGTTDDATAVQVAMDAAAVNGGTVVITEICAVGSGGWTGLNLTSKSNVTIRGQNKGSGFKVLVTPSQFIDDLGVSYFTLFKFDTSTFIEVKDLTINLNSKDTFGLGFQACTSCVAEGNYIYDCGVGGTQATGISFTSGSNNRIMNNEVYQCHVSIRAGVSNAGKQETDVIVSGNLSDQTGVVSNSGMVNCVEGGTISNNIVTGSSASGIIVTGSTNQTSSNVTITGNYTHTNGFSGIQIDTATDALVKGVSITGNVSENNQINGIMLFQVEDAVCSGNIVRDNNQAGGTNPEIYLVSNSVTGIASKNVNISNNTISDSGGATAYNGIKIDTSTFDFTNIIVSNNLVTDMSHNGLWLIAQTGSTSDGLTVIGNSIKGSGAIGLSVQGEWTEGTIANNTILDSTTSDIDIGSTNGGFNIIGNTTNFAGADHIALSTAQNLSNNQHSIRTTTDNTAVTAWTMTIPEDTVVLVTAEVVVGDVSGGNLVDQAAYKFDVVVHRDTGGNVTIVDGVNSNLLYESDGTWSATFDVTTTNVRLRLQGDGTNPTNFRFKINSTVVVAI